MKNFEHKRVFVTGAGIGIGYGMCRAFAHAGAIVGLNDMDAEVANTAAQTINAELDSEKVFPYICDIADVAALRATIADFVATYNGLDVVVANAGITKYGAFLSYTPEDFDQLLGVNLRGTYFTVQAAAQAMIERQIAGRIILMSSVTGEQAFVSLGTYGISKAGIRMMARSLALELAPHRITVNAISPGATLTERTERDDPNYAENWGGVTPTGRVGHVEDIVQTALFLASDGAEHITGQTIQVDGGWTLRSPLPDDHP